MKLKMHHYFYLFVGFLFLVIVSVELFSDGMFMDGLLYADISRNMAEGLGSFWKPHLTYGLFPEFYEHPPLAFGLQSLLFKIFGDSIYVERIYSLLTYIVVGYLIVLIWEILTKEKKNGWIPLFFWSITSDVAWAVANNMLENTMSVFVCLAVFFYFKSNKEKRFLWISLSAISLSLGLLTKGFFCLYIWGVPFFMWVFKRNKSFLQMTVDTVALVLVTILPIALLYFTSIDAQNNMLNYFRNQVISSIQSVQTVDSRFAILGGFFSSIAIPLIVGFFIIMIALKMKVQKYLFKLNIREFFMFTAIALSGVIPIMISLKQRNFYILTVYPLFAIGLAYCLYPIIKLAISKITTESKGFKIFKGVTIGIIFTSIILTISQINRVGRDKAMINDCKAVINTVGKDITINICPNMFSIWNLHGYFSRYGNLSLDCNQKNVCQYYLSLDDCNKDVLEKDYYIVPIETEKYKLYQLKENKNQASQNELGTIKTLNKE
jgi:4-amino-4-deoxy-L-arabinose transferase-like glycosyltransferase